MVCQDFRLSDSEIAQKSAPKRRADFGRRCQHRGDAGLDVNVEVAPGGIAVLDGFKHRRRHREHAGIAARDHGDLAAFGGERQRVTRPLDLDAVVGGMAALAGNGFGNSIEIGSISDEIASRHAARAWRPASTDRAIRAQDRQRRANRSQPPPLSGNQHHREIGTADIRTFRQRHDLFARHGAALDIDCARQQSRGFDGAPDFCEILADLHDDGGIGVGKAAGQLLFAEVPGNTERMSSPQVIGALARVQQPDMPVTPGTTSIGKTASRRRHICMNEP